LKIEADYLEAIFEFTRPQLGYLKKVDFNLSQKLILFQSGDLRIF
jgi:hypothetical protein